MAYNEAVQRLRRQKPELEELLTSLDQRSLADASKVGRYGQALQSGPRLRFVQQWENELSDLRRREREQVTKSLKAARHKCELLAEVHGGFASCEEQFAQILVAVDHALIASVPETIRAGRQANLIVDTTNGNLRAVWTDLGSERGTEFDLTELLCWAVTEHSDFDDAEARPIANCLFELLKDGRLPLSSVKRSQCRPDDRKVVVELASPEDDEQMDAPFDEFAADRRANEDDVRNFLERTESAEGVVSACIQDVMNKYSATAEDLETLLTDAAKKDLHVSETQDLDGSDELVDPRAVSNSIENVVRDIRKILKKELEAEVASLLLRFTMCRWLQYGYVDENNPLEDTKHYVIDRLVKQISLGSSEDETRSKR